MNHQQLADLLFPAVTQTVADLEKRFPARALPEGAKVTRLGPSPTGFIHIGNLYGAMADERLAVLSQGVFFLRIEDTDDKREVAGAEKIIRDALIYFGIQPMEGVTDEGQQGAYGSYRQSERKDIYHICAKALVMAGHAYPSFATAEDLEALRAKQEAAKADPGYYGIWATDRHLTLEEVQERLEKGMPWTLRLRSRALPGDGYPMPDGIRGSVTVHPNHQDIVLLKTNGMPTYHFAHVVDDHFMRVTHVLRGEEWLSTLPVHIELFELFGWTLPTYCHTAHLMKNDNDTRRKLSKRLDPEMSLSFYMEKGYHPLAVREYLMVLLNSNYEEWRLANPESPLEAFPFSLDKMATSGALYDMVKLDDVSKEALAHIPEADLAAFLLDWAKAYQLTAAPILEAHLDEVRQLLAIGRDGKKPRKDLIYAEQMWAHIAYFFDEYYELEAALPERVSREDALQMIDAYLKAYDGSEDNSIWFGKLRDMGTAYGYAAKPKDFKKEPEAYKGHVGDVSGLIRLAVTGRLQSPDLWTIQQIMGEERVRARIEAYRKTLT